MKDHEGARVSIGMLQAFKSLDEITQRTIIVCMTVVIAAVLAVIPSCVGEMERESTERLRLRVQDNQHWRETRGR